MSIIEEFKEFILRGNIIELAIGFIMGLAFNNVVSSLVNDILMPPIGLLLGGIDFSHYKLVLKPAATNSPEVAIRLGAFINQVIYFLIIAATVFTIIKASNKLFAQKKKEEETKPPEPPEEVKLLREIRDLLKTQATQKP